jgi:hypothetical protein
VAAWHLGRRRDIVSELTEMTSRSSLHARGALLQTIALWPFAHHFKRLQIQERSQNGHWGVQHVELASRPRAMLEMPWG